MSATTTEGPAQSGPFLYPPVDARPPAGPVGKPIPLLIPGCMRQTGPSFSRHAA